MTNRRYRDCKNCLDELNPYVRWSVRDRTKAYGVYLRPEERIIIEEAGEAGEEERKESIEVNQPSN
jgi:hypothetical protein